MGSQRILFLVLANVILIGTFSAFFVPTAGAQPTIQIVEPCADGDAKCNFNDLLLLARRFMNALILLSIPLSAISFAWAGWLLVTAGGNPGQLEKAKEIFWKVLIGLILVLAAWLIVYWITKPLLEEGYSLLQAS